MKDPTSGFVPGSKVDVEAIAIDKGTSFRKRCALQEVQDETPTDHLSGHPSQQPQLDEMSDETLLIQRSWGSKKKFASDKRQMLETYLKVLFLTSIAYLMWPFILPGVLLLGELLTLLMSKPLSDATIHILIALFTKNLENWGALNGALVGCLALMWRKTDVGVVTENDAKAVINSYRKYLSIQSNGRQHDRKLCFELLECLLEWYPNVVHHLVTPRSDDVGKDVKKQIEDLISVDNWG
ncbi:hypothetical protein ACH5RR_007991 [Cinchona calisaya]|uniref:MMS19 nucleotide excision repair protein n=1 Tax=Cinchona calisaya TaxID=153742 RepID=A0ABD3AAG5_9GENT